MDATTQQLNTLQLIAKRAIDRGDYHFTLIASEMAVAINCVDYLSIVLKGIAHHKLKNYKQSKNHFEYVIKNVDALTRNEVEIMMKEYNIPLDILFFETVVAVQNKVRMKMLSRVVAMMAVTILPFVFYISKL